ncbi:MAG: LarC family nickel insertion protein, partial [Deltaproteobacteria bacterium]|nr:LarC family nickel insertion protein [Deltaproteobacteria bacterium]
IIAGRESQSASRVSDEILEDSIEIIESNIDDMNPEFFGHLMDRLFEDGALDVSWIPVYMKKNRPGNMLRVLCKSDRREILIHRILSESTTLGVRFYESRRRLLWRDHVEVETSYGIIGVKRVKDLQGNIRIIPEYDVCQKIALEHDLPLRIVYETVAKEAAVRNED